MALINCPECGKEISDQAVSCPNCGLPIKKTKEKKSFNKLFIIIPFVVIVLAVGGFIAYRIIHTNSPEYVLKKYIEAFNNRDEKEMEKYEYNYKNYTIVHSFYNILINEERDNVTTYKLINDGDDSKFIYDNTVTYIFSVKGSSSDISYIYVYEITNGNYSSTKNNDIVVGKVNGKWKIVRSPFYRLE